MSFLLSCSIFFFFLFKLRSNSRFTWTEVSSVFVIAFIFHESGVLLVASEKCWIAGQSRADTPKERRRSGNPSRSDRSHTTTKQQQPHIEETKTCSVLCLLSEQPLRVCCSLISSLCSLRQHNTIKHKHKQFATIEA